MERRKLVTVTTGGIISVLAGCSSLTADPAVIGIDTVEHPSEAQHDEGIDVSVRAENTGDESGTDTIVVEFAESVVDATEITVDGQQTETTQFNIPADDMSPGSHSLTVSTDEDSYSSQVNVADPEPATLEITTVQKTPFTAHDEPLSVRVTVTNTGDLRAEQDITLKVEDTTVASEAVSVNASEQKTVELDVPEDEYFSGQYTLTATTDDDEQTSTFQVENPNPYGKQTLVVSLEQRTPARHDMQDIITEALTYWRRNAEQYADYPIDYEYRPNATDPDVEIIVVDQIVNCGEHNGEEVAGCAPLVTSRSPDPATIRIVDGYRKTWMTTTLKHELGHTLGLDHQSEPLHIMSNDIEDRIPDYYDRRAAIDSYIDAFEPKRNGNTAWDTMGDNWSSGNYAAAESAARDAYSYWFESERAVRQARDTAETLNEDTAYDLLNESEQNVRALRLAADAAVSMTQAAQQRYTDPNPYREESNDYLDEANQYTFHDSIEISQAFGFPTKQ